jgi:Cu+-exporting ATPase
MIVIDPVCNMTVEDDEAAATVEYEGKTYYFCSVGCRNDFQEDPEVYLRQE